MPRRPSAKTPPATGGTPATSKTSSKTAGETAGRRLPPGAIDLDAYAPAYFTWIANKLSSGASRAYLTTFDVGIEVWRLLVLLAIEPALSASQMCEVIGMDKASVSRALRTMQARGLITIGLDADDGRLRVARITAKGRKLHDQIAGLALERQAALLSVLDDGERATLIRLLHKLHDNLGNVETATERYLARMAGPGRKPQIP